MNMSLPCSVIRDLLPLYAEDVMEEENKHLVEEHLETCSDCKKALEELQEPKPAAAISDTVEVGVSGGFTTFGSPAVLVHNMSVAGK